MPLITFSGVHGRYNVNIDNIDYAVDQSRTIELKPGAHVAYTDYVIESSSIFAIGIFQHNQRIGVIGVRQRIKGINPISKTNFIVKPEITPQIQISAELRAELAVHDSLSPSFVNEILIHNEV